MVTHQTREIPRDAWRTFFDSVSKEIRGKAVDVTLCSPAFTAHQCCLWELHGLTYDPHDDALIVSCRQQEHVIDCPEAIRIEREGVSLHSIDVQKQAGEHELITFIDPLLLPAA